MVDTGDLKSPGSNTVGVRLPLRAKQNLAVPGFFLHGSDAPACIAWGSRVELDVLHCKTERDRRPGSAGLWARREGTLSPSNLDNL